MIRRILPAVVLLAVGLLSGCGPEVHYVSSDPTILTPKPDGYDMPFSYETPDRPLKVLGRVTVSSKIQPSFRETSTFDQVLGEMKKRARNVGADAIVGLRTLDSSDGGEHGRLTMEGTLVIFTAPEALSSR